MVIEDEPSDENPFVQSAFKVIRVKNSHKEEKEDDYILLTISFIVGDIIFYKGL